MHKTPSEGKVILDRILENTSVMTQCDEPPLDAFVSKIEEPLTVESQPEISTTTESTGEVVPEPSSIENKEKFRLWIVLQFYSRKHHKRSHFLFKCR